MLKKGNTLHFINRVDAYNCGDEMVCPIFYYYDFFKQYKIKRHDVRFIEFESIDSGDVVIFGGGGLLNYAEFMNRSINKLLDIGAAVIAWAPGFNTHFAYDGTFKTNINFEKFTLLAVRDYDNSYGIDYLPDVTCKLKELTETYKVKRKYGIACHRDYPVEGLDFDSIPNSESLENILRFIGESEVIISDSYHMIYWSTLMRKKVICTVPFSTRFQHFQYKPIYWNPQTETIEECANRATAYNVLDELISKTDAFFEQVKTIICSKLTPCEDSHEKVHNTTREALLTEQYRELVLMNGDPFSSQLLIDDGTGFVEEKKRIAINNVYGDVVHEVRFELKNYTNIKAIRFDPLENKLCRVKIVSAITENGKIDFHALTSIKQDDWDVFFTTDPRYVSTDCISNFVLIQFKLELLSKNDSEQIAEYIYHKEKELKSDNDRQNDKILDLKNKNEKLATKTQEINEQNLALNKRNSELEQKNVEELQENEELKQKNFEAFRTIKELEKRNSEILQELTGLKHINSVQNQKNLEMQKEKDDLEVENLNIKKSNSDKNKKIEILEQKIVLCEQEITNMVESRSWKWTAPLRKLQYMFKRKEEGST